MRAAILIVLIIIVIGAAAIYSWWSGKAACSPSNCNPSLGLTCSGGKCVFACTKDSDCKGANESCAGGACLPRNYAYSYVWQGPMGQASFTTAAGADECNSKCAATPWCRAWTFRMGDDLGCRLYDKGGCATTANGYVSDAAAAKAPCTGQGCPLEVAVSTVPCNTDGDCVYPNAPAGLTTCFTTSTGRFCAGASLFDLTCGLPPGPPPPVATLEPALQAACANSKKGDACSVPVSGGRSISGRCAMMCDVGSNCTKDCSTTLQCMPAQICMGQAGSSTPMNPYGICTDSTSVGACFS